MKTVKIYTIEQTSGVMMCEVGTHYSLYPWGEDTEIIKGSDNGGTDYILPDGFFVGMDGSGMKQIFTEKGEYCPIIAFGHTPALLTSRNGRDEKILLKKA